MLAVLVVLIGAALAGPALPSSAVWLAARPAVPPAQVKSIALLPVHAGSQVPKDVVKNIESLVTERLAALAPNMRLMHPNFKAIMGPSAARAAQRCEKPPCLAKLASTLGTDSVLLVNLTQVAGKLQLRLAWVDIKRAMLGKRVENLGKGRPDSVAAVQRALTAILGPGAKLGATEPSGDPSTAPLDEIIGWLVANVKDFTDGDALYAYDWSRAMADCRLTITERAVDKDSGNSVLTQTTQANAKVMDASHFRVIREGSSWGVQQDCPFACSEVIFPDETKQQRKQVTVYTARKATAERLQASLVRWATLCNSQPP